MTATLSQEAIDTIDHVGLQDGGRFLESNFDVASSSKSLAYITFRTRRDLPVGQHSGRVNFHLCMDADCRSTATTTPFVLTYQITVTPPPPAAVITPSAIQGSVESGDILVVSLAAQVVAGLEVGGFAVVDQQRRFQPAVQIVSRDEQRFTISLSALPLDAPGTHSGTVDLMLCYSSYCDTYAQVPGSPVSIPYTLTVTPETLMQPVPSVSGLPEWETFQGNPDHTGYVPTTLNAATFTTGWSWSAPGDIARLSPATTGSGKVVVTAGAGNGTTPTLYALNESNGTVAWSHDFGNRHALNHPAVSAGRVFVTTTGHNDTFMWSFDIGTGARLFQTPFSSQSESHLAPTIKNGYVYTNGGYYGGMYSFKGLTGTQRWHAPLRQYHFWTPAVDDDYAYAHTGFEFVVLNRRTGERALTVPNSQINSRGYALNIAPVLLGNGSAIVVDGIYSFSDLEHNNHLIRYSVADAGETWRVAGQFRSNPVVADGTIYVSNNAARQLEARDEASGALLWAWSPSDASESLPIGNLVLTDNMIFLSSSAATYAIDLSSHQPVWSTPRTGHLALSSNRILYVVDGAMGRIDAYRLAP